MGSMVLGTEEEIKELSVNLMVAEEALQANIDKLARIKYIYRDVRRYGVSRTSMESLQQLAGDILPENSQPNMYTVKPSYVGMNYATEGFITAIFDAIKWVLRQILEIIQYIIKGIASLIEWLIDEEKRTKKHYGYTDSEIEKLINERDQLMAQKNDVMDLIKKLPEDKQRKYLEPMNKVLHDIENQFANQFFVDVINDSPVTSFENQKLVAAGLLSIIKQLIDGNAYILKEVNNVLDNPSFTNVDKLPNILTTYLEADLVKDAMRIPYDKQVLLSAAEAPKNMFSPETQSKINVVDTKIINKPGVNRFFNLVVFDEKHQREADKTEWGKQENSSIFLAGKHKTVKKEDLPDLRNLTVMKITKPDEYKDNVNVIQISQKSYKKAYEEAKREVDDFIKKLDSLKTEDGLKILLTKHITNPDDYNRIIWPKDKRGAMMNLSNEGTPVDENQGMRCLEFINDIISTPQMFRIYVEACATTRGAVADIIRAIHYRNRCEIIVLKYIDESFKLYAKKEEIEKELAK